MADVTIKTETSAPIAMLRRGREALEQPNITYAVRDGALILARGIDRRAPRRSGRLARSFQVSPVSATEYTVGSDLIYAPVHEFGAVIFPRRRRFLRFVIAGRVIFAKKVTIPARPYVEPTFVEDGQRALDRVAERIERAI